MKIKNKVIKNKVILVVNFGSSSLKLALFFIKDGELLESGNGVREKISFTLENIDQKNLYLKIQHFVSKNRLEKIDIVVHRVVHGGKFNKPMLLTKNVLNEIKKYSEFAPLHNPYNIYGIEICQKLFARAKHYALFDTVFHNTITEKAKIYALPFSFYKKGIYRYGFHGHNSAYCTAIMQNYLKKKTNKLIICHLGNGCSITAVKDGKSVDTSMGFSPNEGLVMGTRSGDIGIGVLEYLLKKYSSLEVFSILEKKSGLLGISGISNDVKELRKISLGNGKKAKRAKLALDIFAYRIVKYIGAYYAVLEGCDAIVFTGGIGENAWYLREEICKQFSFLGVNLNQNQNKLNEFEISVIDSKIKVFVIPANEELQMAKDIYIKC